MRAVLIAAVCVRVLVSASPADAGCESASPFDLYDRAERVIVGTVTTSAAKRKHEPRAPVLVDVEAAIKGGADPHATVLPGEPGMCAAELFSGERVLLFLDRRGAVVGDLEGSIVLPDAGSAVDPAKAGPDWPALVTRWGKAANDTSRLDMLIELLELPELSGARNDAADYVVNTPRLLALIDDKRRARIVKSLAGNHWMPNYTILILARLRAPELPALLDEPGHGWAYAKGMRALLAADQFAAVTDRAALAASMVGKGSTLATRTAALDRCERLRGESFYSYVGLLYDLSYDDDRVDWKKLAAACKR